MVEQQKRCITLNYSSEVLNRLVSVQNFDTEQEHYEREKYLGKHMSKLIAKNIFLGDEDWNIIGSECVGDLLHVEAYADNDNMEVVNMSSSSLLSNLFDCNRFQRTGSYSDSLLCG